MTSHYELSILLRMDSFVFMATDDRQSVQLIRAYNLETAGMPPEKQKEELLRLIEGDPDLKAPFRNIRIALVSALHTLIPNRLFNPGEKKVYLEQITTLHDDLEIRSEELPGLAAQNVYAHSRTLLGLLTSKFPGARIHHISSVLLNGYRSLARFLEGKRVFLHVWTKWVQIVLHEDDELRFINLFPFQHPKDFIYYVLLVFDQYKLDPEEVNVHVSGQITADSELFRFLLRYIRKVEMLPLPAYLKPGPALRQTPGHQYYDLFSILNYN